MRDDGKAVWVARVGKNLFALFPVFRLFATMNESRPKPETANRLVEWLTAEMAAMADAKSAEGMSAYMKNRFVFFGIPKPLRAKVVKPFLDAFKHLGMDEVWRAAELLWQRDERECHYVALELLVKFKKKLRAQDLSKLEEFIVTHAWWDSVDGLAAHPVGMYFQLFPEGKETKARQWIESENMWLRRTAIIFQLNYKAETNVELLEELILIEIESREFFIQKAIGWALRQYARINPDRVRTFANNSPLKPLSKREALKHL